MMNTVIIITSDYTILHKYIKHDNVIFSFVIDSVASLERLSLDILHNSVLFDNKNIYFSLHLNFSEIKSSSFSQILEKQNHLLMQYFFHPKYYIVEGMPVISLNEEDCMILNFKKLFFHLDKHSVDQGFNGIHPLYFTTKDLVGKENFNIFFNEAEGLDIFFNKYYELLNERFYVSKYIGMRVDDMDGFIDAVSATEIKLCNENPYLFEHLNTFCLLKKSESELTENINLISEDLSNQKVYLKILKNQDEAIKINEFYQNEYEVLPLWYKQLGHFIKAIMGKRTWGSLFNNNVKKYKN